MTIFTSRTWQILYNNTTFLSIFAWQFWSVRWEWFFCANIYSSLPRGTIVRSGYPPEPTSDVYWRPYFVESFVKIEGEKYLERPSSWVTKHWLDRSSYLNMMTWNNHMLQLSNNDSLLRRVTRPPQSKGGSNSGRWQLGRVTTYCHVLTIRGPGHAIGPNHDTIINRRFLKKKVTGRWRLQVCKNHHNVYLYMFSKIYRNTCL